MRCTIILFLISLFVPSGLAQELSFEEEIAFVYPTEGHHAEHLMEQEKPTSEYKLGLNSLLVFYKVFFSSQDSENCTFHPSCSEYSVLAFQAKGLLGFFLTFDRLTRCHGLSPEHYEVHESGLLNDPIE